jgi:putative MFS transporter
MDSARLTPYQRRLFVFLGVATFFEGFDFLALTQLLPELRAEFGLGVQAGASMVGAINAGTIAAWLLIRQADRVGRKRILSLTILGYATCTLLSGLAWSTASFTLFQFAARVFLIAEWATAMIYASESFPSARRGMVLGVLQGFSALGGVLCVGLVPALTALPGGWRNVYFVGVIPLLLLAFVRRNLRETPAFELAQETGGMEARGVLGVLQTPQRKRVLQLGLLWFLTYVCANTAVTFWKEHMVSDLGWTATDVARSLTFAALVSMPFVFGTGRLLDAIGRRRGAVIVYLITAAGVWGAYGIDANPQEHWPITCALTLAIFGVSGVLVVLNAFTTELVPTALRGDALALSNNLLGRIGYVLAPFGVGWVAARSDWGAAVQPTVFFLVAALAGILWLLPEPSEGDREDRPTAANNVDERP